MRFNSVEWIYCLWILPFIAAFFSLAWLKREKILRSMGDKALIARIGTFASKSTFVWRHVCIICGLLCFVLALMRPLGGYTWQEFSRKGSDIIVAIDLSNSMLAQDMAPSRLQFAKNKIKDLLGLVQGDRIGLVAFSGTAFLQCPLTADYGAFQIFLDYLDTDLIPVKGTSLTAAIETSIKAFDAAKSSSKSLLIITDGEDLDPKALEAASKAKNANITIYTLGIGTTKGAPIPNASGGDFKKNAQGEMIFSKLDEHMLRTLAADTGGIFQYATPDDSDFQKIYSDKITGKNTEDKENQIRTKKYTDMFQFPLFLGLCFILLESFLNLRNGRRLKIFLLLGILGALSNSRAFASPFFSERHLGEQLFENGKYPEAVGKFEQQMPSNPNDLELQYNLGSAYYKNGEFKKAENAWTSVLEKNKNTDATAKKLQADTHYNLGNSFYKQGRLEDSAEQYRQTKLLNPSDIEASSNLERVLAEIKKRKEQEQKNKDKNKEQNKDKNKDQQQKNEDKNSDNNKEQEKKPGDASQPTPSPTPGTGQASPTPSASEEQTPKPDKQASEAASQVDKKEAERILSTIDDNPKNALKQKMQKKFKNQRTEKLNDW